MVNLFYGYLPDNITIDAASFFISSAGSSTDTYNVHIMSYDIDTDNGATSGDLSGGVVVVDSTTIASDRTAIKYKSYVEFKVRM